MDISEQGLEALAERLAGSTDKDTILKALQHVRDAEEAVQTEEIERLRGVLTQTQTDLQAQLAGMQRLGELCERRHGETAGDAVVRVAAAYKLMLLFGTPAEQAVEQLSLALYPFAWAYEHTMRPGLFTHADASEQCSRVVANCCWANASDVLHRVATVVKHGNEKA